MSCLQGYKLEAYKAAMQNELNCPELDFKLNVIFGNLDEIHKFHSKVFLMDLENCISSTDLVALCFLQKVSKTHYLSVSKNKLLYRVPSLESPANEHVAFQFLA